MKSRALRGALLALLLGGIAGAAYVVWDEETQGAATAAVSHTFDEQAQAIARSLRDIKGAQPGYVAAGQGEDYWITKVDGLIASAREGFSALVPATRTAAAAGDVESASAAFEDFRQMDRRAREYARSGQKLLASDLVFSDGIEKMDAALAALERARLTELSARDATLGLHRRMQLTALGGAAVLALLVTFALVPLPRQELPVITEVKPQPEIAAAPRRVVAPGALASLPPVPPAVPKAPPTPAFDLKSIAAVCTELARIPDHTGLPAALERAAKVLDATGVVVWVVDPDGRELVPVIGHGYPANLFSRLGTIARDAENATAAAFRTGVLQTVKADPVSNGSIAAPLVTPPGPVGVMSAEVLHGGEQKEATRAAAAIVAAQLASLMGPPSSRSKEAAGA